jgi:hypothetical protein
MLTITPATLDTKKDPRSRSRTSDLEISIASSYSLPLYQLSYTRISGCTAVLAEWLRRMLKAHVRKSVGSIPTDCIFVFRSSWMAQSVARPAVNR